MEHGSHTPLVFAATSGMGKAAQVTYKALVSMLAVKRDHHQMLDQLPLVEIPSGTLEDQNHHRSCYQDLSQCDHQ